MAHFNGEVHSIYILKTPRYQDLPEKSPNVIFSQNPGTDSADEGEGVSGMNENDDEYDDSAEEGESVSGINEDDDDEDVIEGMDWSEQVALEQGS